MANISAARPFNLKGMPEWRLLGVGFGEKFGGDRAVYERVLVDGTRLRAKVREHNGRPVCSEITAYFESHARDFGRELAISELERVINDNELYKFTDARAGELVPAFSPSEIPVGIPVLGSRGRPPEWTDARLAELVRDLENDEADKWHLERRTVRQRANEAVKRGIAEAVESRPKTWRLTRRGQRLLGP